MQLIPGDQPGDGQIAIDNHPTKFWRVTAGVDNSGQRATGEVQAKASAEIEDLLGIDDYFGLFHNQSEFDNASYQSTNSWTLNSSIPYGYWRLNTAVNYMEYRSQLLGQNQTFQTAGTQRSASLGIDRLLYRDGTGKTFASLSLTYKSVSNSVLDTVTESNSPKLAIVALALDDVRHLATGILYSRVQCNEGLQILGARDDSEWPGSPKAQFTDYQGDLSYGLPIDAFPLPVTWTATSHGQWTTDSLYSTEQIMLRFR